ncbi:MAG TPA: maleylpyruvate isomerase N-terminal domain-containing protein [Acidimicrobiia bacterium]|nr:maleylpyruvate isomerase N-terminal domain-containing protein [Acidimicrobiia bacterium]
MSSSSPADVRELFLQTARVVQEAICDDAVGRAWDRPSVLDEQTVGGVAGHLARGGVWVVEDYLDAELPDAPRLKSAAAYFARSADFLKADDHRQIRRRGAEVAAEGQLALCSKLGDRLEALAARLPTEPADRYVGVAAGVAVMLLDPYLETRIVEQVVHLDDLARSVDRAPWPVPVAAQNLVIHIGVDVGALRTGATAMLRTLYRSRLDPTLPVL